MDDGKAQGIRGLRRGGPWIHQKLGSVTCSICVRARDADILRHGLKIGICQAPQQEKRRCLDGEDLGIRVVGKFPYVRMVFSSFSLFFTTLLDIPFPLTLPF